MILDAPASSSASDGGSGMTLDGLFRRTAVRRPDAIALADPPNRPAFTDGAPLRLTYAEADRIVGFIAGRLERMGLPKGTVVGIQLPNIAEQVLTLLAVLRAGLIAAPLPLLWRRAEAATALSRVNAKVLIACGRAGRCALGEHALRVAADVFPIRYVCGFGRDLPDGMVSFDDLVRSTACESVAPAADRAADNLAVITFEVGLEGPVAVARRHVELLAGGISTLLESHAGHGAIWLTAIAASTFAGLCLSVVPWLLTGGTLVLHHPFDSEIFAGQTRSEGADSLVLPAPVAFRLTDAGVLKTDAVLFATWPAPEWLAASAAWRTKHIRLVDVPIFGETGLLVLRRDAAGYPMPIPLGALALPRGSADAVATIEVASTAHRTVALRGPMVPRTPFPLGVESTGQPHFAVAVDGFVDTGLRCRHDPAQRAIEITGSPTGINPLIAAAFASLAELPLPRAVGQ